MVGNKQGELMHFILIDDDPVSNMLNQNIIKRHFQSSKFTVFTDPQEALSFLKTIDNEVVILLDINMPVLSGWDVLDNVIQFPKQTINLLKIFIVSSSIDICDREQAAANALVLGYLEKPITSNQIVQQFAVLKTN